MHEGVAQKLSLPRPFEISNSNGHKSISFEANNFSFWI